LSPGSLTIGIDVGGTFTDFLLVDEDAGTYLAHKSPSTPVDPSEGVLRGLTEVAERLGLETPEFLSRIALIVHGTTVTTNAVLTERGARTGLLTTEGFRDVLEMRRGVRSRKHLYDNKYVAPRPLVPRYLRLPVRERVDVGGDVRTTLDEGSLRIALEQLRTERVEAIAVCFMHSYANDEHEQRAKAIVEEVVPDVFLSISSELLPQVRLNNRVSTTVMNSYVGPVLRAYVDRLVGRLAETAFDGVLLVMQSNGGVATPEVVARFPATTVLSGPAGGPVAGLAYAEARGSRDCIVVDMGGTSFDASIVKDGEVQVTREAEINRHTISLPATDIHTIGAGGGSIGWIDQGGLLHMGPQSAGADPGPAAYGRGGSEPTCTDADLVLGYLDPEFFLGGRMRLQPALARAAIEERIASPLGIDAVAAAAAMVEVITLVMAAGTKDMSLQRGYDPRELPLVAAGGAGPVHAGMIAAELDIPLVIVPRLSSVLCALGMLLADLRHDYVRSYGRLWVQLDRAEARGLIDAMVARGLAALEEEGVPPDRRDALAAADLRYLGQHHEVTVPFAPADLDDAAGVERIELAFHRRHEELYGFSSPGRQLEVISLHATVLGRRPSLSVELAGRDADGAPAPRKGSRRAYLPSVRALEEIDVYDGDRMLAGHRIAGPAIVEETTTTVFVPEAFDLELDRSGSFVLTRKAA
jgi:N-methylhydantoinase A